MEQDGVKNEGLRGGEKERRNEKRYRYNIFYFTILRGGEREEDWKILTEILFCWNRLDRQADTW